MAGHTLCASAPSRLTHTNTHTHGLHTSSGVCLIPPWMREGGATMPAFEYITNSMILPASATRNEHRHRDVRRVAARSGGFWWVPCRRHSKELLSSQLNCHSCKYTIAQNCTIHIQMYILILFKCVQAQGCANAGPRNTRAIAIN